MNPYTLRCQDVDEKHEIPENTRCNTKFSHPHVTDTLALSYGQIEENDYHANHMRMPSNNTKYNSLRGHPIRKWYIIHDPDKQNV